MDVDKVCFVVKLGNSYLINPSLIGKTISFGFEDTLLSLLTKCQTLCEKEQRKGMDENKIKMFFDSKNN